MWGHWPHAQITTYVKILMNERNIWLGTGTKNTRRPSALSVPMTSYFWCKKELMISFWAATQSICSTKKLSGQLSNPMTDRPETNTHLFTISFPNSNNYQFNWSPYKHSKPKNDALLNIIDSW